MTMTLSEPTGTPSALGPSEASTVTPLGQAPAVTPGTPEIVSEAERLLTAPERDRRAFGTRLLWGLGGLTALGAGPRLALALTRAVPLPDRGAWEVAGGMLALPIAAALTVSLPLPGLLILLGMQNDRAEPRACLHAVSLGYFRMGLVALGLSPILVLYASTGARHGVLAGAALAYFGAGGVALALLLGDLYRCLPKGRGTSRLMLFAWACFVCLLAVYFFFKLQPFV
ncbi:MAG TPA: hypothetical protein VFU02_03635 [Polyangiaceae bacterium]|nr:hypothetical protein [Polyangiaceae bacterium]